MMECARCRTPLPDTARFCLKGDHKYSFGLGDVLGGTVSGDRGALRFKVGAGTERLSVREWESVFEAVIVARFQ